MNNSNNNEVKQDDNHLLHPDQANLENRRSSFRFRTKFQIFLRNFLFTFPSSNRPPLLRSPSVRTSPGILDAVSNVVEFVKDEKTYRGRRNNIHSRYPKGTSSASTSPDLDRYTRDRHRVGHVQHEFHDRSYPQRPRLYRKGTTSSSSSPCYTYDSYPKGRHQSSYESYEYDTNVLNGKSRSPSPSQRYGNEVL